MARLLLDTHVLHWWAAEGVRLSRTAERAIARADDLAVSSISWYELAWLVRQGRIGLAVPLRQWLENLSLRVVTIGLSPAVAETAASLPASFPNDPADRIIYATAIESGLRLVTKDEQLQKHAGPRAMTIW